jgi:hypothetical protein
MAPSFFGWGYDITGWGFLALGLIGSGMLFTHLHTTIEPAHEAMVRRMNAEHTFTAPHGPSRNISAPSVPSKYTKCYIPDIPNDKY